MKPERRCINGPIFRCRPEVRGQLGLDKGYGPFTSRHVRRGREAHARAGSHATRTDRVDRDNQSSLRHATLEWDSLNGGQTPNWRSKSSADGRDSLVLTAQWSRAGGLMAEEATLRAARR